VGDHVRRLEATAEHASLAALALSWRETDVGEYPYSTVYDGQRLVLRVNDGPDEASLYTLMIDGRPVLDVEEWPAAWRRSRDRA
jgi:hypothetical protein